MSPKATLQLILAALVALALVAGYVMARGHFQHVADLEAYKAQAQPIAEATASGQQSLATATTATTAQEASVAGRRTRLDRSYEEIRRADPTVASWTDTAIPERLRAADREGEDPAALDRPADPQPRGAGTDHAEDGGGPDPAP